MEKKSISTDPDLGTIGVAYSIDGGAEVAKWGGTDGDFATLGELASGRSGRFAGTFSRSPGGEWKDGKEHPATRGHGQDKVTQDEISEASESVRQGLENSFPAGGEDFKKAEEDEEERKHDGIRERIISLRAKADELESSLPVDV